MWVKTLHKGRNQGQLVLVWTGKVPKISKCKQENIPQLLIIPFSALEENIIDDLKIKVYGPWSKLFCMLDEEASALLMEFVYRQDNSRTMSLEIIKKTCLDYPRNVLPTLKELDDLSPHDVGQIMNSTNSGIAPFFLVSYSIHIGLSAQVHNSPEFLKVDDHYRTKDCIRSYLLYFSDESTCEESKIDNKTGAFRFDVEWNPLSSR